MDSIFRVTAAWTFLLCAAPTSASADRGEGFVSLGVGGNLSFIRNPTLAYADRPPTLNAVTSAVESTFGMGATDWLDMGLGGRFFLPVEVVETGASAQGFPAGEVTYRALAIQAPLSVTGRYARGRATHFALTVEAGVEWARWSLLSSTVPDAPGHPFAVTATSVWSTSFFLGVHPALGWRHFDHFSCHLGPRFSASTTGSLHVGLTLAGTFLWGVGGF